jgi:zinc finger-like protein
VQDFLLDSLQDLLAAVIRANSSDKVHLMREVVCKVDEVSVTLQKHLRKEEEQLFPLLLTHFSFDEQAELVVRTWSKRI